MYGVVTAGGSPWGAAVFVLAGAGLLIWLAPAWLAWFLVMPAPVLTLMPGFHHAVLRDYERFLYSGVAGLAIGLAVCWWKLRRTWPLASAALVVVIVAGWAPATFSSVTDWVEAGRLTRRVQDTLLLHKGSVPPGSLIDCSAVPDTIRNAFAHFNACDAQVQLVWGGGVRGVRDNERGHVPDAGFALSADGTRLLRLEPRTGRAPWAPR